MFSRFNHIKIVLWLILFLLFITPFEFNLQPEIIVITLLIIGAILLHYLLHPKNQTDYKNQLIQAEMKNINLVRQLDEFLISIPVPLVVIDNNLNILLSNISYKQLFNDHKEHLKQIDYSIKKMVNHAIRSSGSTRQTILFNNREYLMSSSHLEYIGQISTLLIFSDITSFIEAQKTQKRFLADASHELKTPITAIKGLSELLLTHEMNREDQIDFLSQIQKESNRLQMIVFDLLELSKLSANRILLNQTSFNFSDLVKDVYHAVKPLIISKGLTFVYDFEKHMVFLDYDRFHQVLSNLMINAINYSDVGHIELKVYDTDTDLVISLKDQGIGIDIKHLPFLFDRFYRIDEDRNRSVGGSGLGLSIVKEIIEAHGGTIHVTSEVNKGTHFIISIPLNN